MKLTRARKKEILLQNGWRNTTAWRVKNGKRGLKTCWEYQDKGIVEDTWFDAWNVHLAISLLADMRNLIEEAKG